MAAKSKRAHLVFILTVILISNSLPALAEKQPKTQCNIRVDNVHLSKSIRAKKGFDAVKVSARSKCNVNMSNLLLTVELRKVGLFRNHLLRVRTLEVSKVIPANFSITNKSTWFKCKNSQSSRYFGVAYAKALISEKIVFTHRVYSERITILECGT